MDVQMDQKTAENSTTNSEIPQSQMALMSQYFSAKKHGRSHLQQTGTLFLSLLRLPEHLPDFFVDEISFYIDALLGREDVDPIYLDILAFLPAESLTDLITELVEGKHKPLDVETRSALLFSLTKIVSAAVKNEKVAHLIARTCQLLLVEAKKHHSAYCNMYREAVVMKFLPLLLARQQRNPEVERICQEMVPDVVRFFTAAALKTLPESGAVYLTPEEIWDSLSELLTELSALWHAEAPPAVVFWNTRQPSIPDLTVWWTHFPNSKASRLNDLRPEELNFSFRFSFFSFLLVFYNDVKTNSDVAERRPFLLDSSILTLVPHDLTNESVKEFSSVRESEEMKLEKIFFLLCEVFYSLSEDHALFSAVVEELQLEESAIYLTFRADLGVARGESVSGRCSKKQPFWLKIQFFVSSFNYALKKNGFSPTVFSQFRETVLLLHRFGDSFSSVQTKKNGPLNDKKLSFISNDSEILEFFCGFLVQFLLKQQLDRASDEFLSTLLVFIQPIIPKNLSVLREITRAIAGRDKFIFRKFFNYVVAVEAVSEVAQTLAGGTVAMELTMEPLTGVVSIHKTRGANRGTTDALLFELQRHVANVSVGSVGSSVGQAVVQFVRDGKEDLAGVIFQQSGGSVSTRRVKSGVLQFS